VVISVVHAIMNADFKCMFDAGATNGLIDLREKSWFRTGILDV